MNIAILENDAVTALFIEETVSRLGHNVLGKFPAADALMDLINVKEVDLVLMDINLQGPINGIECARKIKYRHKEIAVVFITAHKDSKTIRRAKQVSPQGYLIKPFDQSDLEANIMIVEVLRGEKARDFSNISLNAQCRFDLEKSVIEQHDGKVMTLTANELKCLKSLVRYRNSCISTEQLMMNIWGDADNREASLRELVYRLRKKIPDLPLNSVPKVGYVLIGSPGS